MLIHMIIFVLVGAVIGYLAGVIMKSGGGFVRNAVLGILGGAVGGFLGNLIGIGGGMISGIILAILGACLIIFVVDKVTK